MAPVVLNAERQDRILSEIGRHISLEISVSRTSTATYSTEV